MNTHQFLFATNHLERALAKLDNRDFDDLPATGPAFFDAFSQAHYRRNADALRAASGAECGRCGEQVSKLHHFHLDGGNSFLCLSCCQEEEKAWHEDNSQFGVGA